MANIDFDDDNQQYRFDLDKLQSPDARLSLKRAYDYSDMAKDGIPFDAFVAMIETMSGAKIPELH